MQGMAAWEQELAQEVESDFRRRLISSCKEKCISPLYLQDGDLNKGEAVCLDRCVHKFMQTNLLIQKTAGEIGGRIMGSME
ncbi:putative mitochondrial intermembrane space translocase subunit Tim10, partial [Obelidium mucronatum]